MRCRPGQQRSSSATQQGPERHRSSCSSSATQQDPGRHQPSLASITTPALVTIEPVVSSLFSGSCRVRGSVTMDRLAAGSQTASTIAASITIATRHCRTDQQLLQNGVDHHMHRLQLQPCIITSITTPAMHCRPDQQLSRSARTASIISCVIACICAHFFPKLDAIINCTYRTN